MSQTMTAPDKTTSRTELIDRLNEDLAREYQAIIAYIVYSQVLKGAEYMAIASERDGSLRVRGAFEQIADGKRQRADAQKERVRGEEPCEASPVGVRVVLTTAAARMFSAVTVGNPPIRFRDVEL